LRGAGDAFAQQAIGAHHRAIGDQRTGLVFVDHQQVIAQRIIGIGIELIEQALGAGAHLVKEHLPAQVLHSRQIGRIARQAHGQAARPLFDPDHITHALRPPFGTV
jgi:hypothetical protein